MVLSIFQSHGSALRELRLGRFDGLLGTTRIAGVSEPSLQVLPPAAVPQVEVIVARATWLILPVVICLSQRLSHACLSMNGSYSETANGSLNLKSVIVYLMVPYYMDNCSNSRANTCRKSRLCGRDVFIRSKANAGGNLRTLGDS